MSINVKYLLYVLKIYGADEGRIAFKIIRINRKPPNKIPIIFPFENLEFISSLYPELK